jgi:hypothetical protein
MGTGTGISAAKLVNRLEKLEREQRRKRREERWLPVRERELRRKKRWVRRMLNKYMKIRELLYGSMTIRFEANGSSADNKFWDIQHVDLMHLCLDVELAIESLAWTGRGREETEVGRNMRQLFIVHALEGESLSSAARRLGLTQRQARVMWESAVEEIWESLEDYDDERVKARSFRSSDSFKKEKRPDLAT